MEAAGLLKARVIFDDVIAERLHAETVNALTFEDGVRSVLIFMKAHGWIYQRILGFIHK